MSSTLPAFNVRQQSYERLETRSAWAEDFDKNHAAFAETLASKIAKEALEEFQQTLSDPYMKPITADRKFTKNFYLDVTDKEHAEKIVKTFQEKEIPSPFNEWLTHFSDEEKRRVDRKYFKEQMAIVGSIARTKIDESLALFAGKETKFKYNVVWHSKPDQLLSNPSDFRDTCLTIECWSTFHNSTAMQEHPKAVTEQRVKQADITKERKRLCYTVLGLITAFAVAVTSSVSMQSQHYDN